MSLAFNGSSNSSLYVTFFSGLSQYTVAYNNGSVQVPNELAQMGVVYAILTNGNQSTSDDNTVAGPAILNFPTNVTVDIERGNTTGLVSNTNSASSAFGNIDVTFLVAFTAVLFSILAF